MIWYAMIWYDIIYFLPGWGGHQAHRPQGEGSRRWGPAARYGRRKLFCIDYRVRLPLVSPFPCWNGDTKGHSIIYAQYFPPMVCIFYMRNLLGWLRLGWLEIPPTTRKLTKWIAALLRRPRLSRPRATAVDTNTLPRVFPAAPQDESRTWLQHL